MKQMKPKDTVMMGPPRLTLVPKDDERTSDPTAHASVPPPLPDPEAGPLAVSVDEEGVASRDAGRDEDRVIANDDSIAAVPAEPVEVDPVAVLAAQDRREKLRIIEAVLFASPEPMREEDLAMSLIEGEDIAGLLSELQQTYATRGINLTKVAGKWAYRTADDLSYLLQRYAREERRLSKAALETLSIIAYHQPVTRAEIEEVRGVSTSAGTIDILLETGWIRPRGRRRAPGRPVTYGTTEGFLEHFGLDTIKDLPGLSELKGAGLLDATLPPGFTMPEPTDVAALMPDELPLEDTEEDDTQGALALDGDADQDEEVRAGNEDAQPEAALSDAAMPLSDPFAEHGEDRNDRINDENDGTESDAADPTDHQG
jgi:segregation and condensation protein B